MERKGDDSWQSKVADALKKLADAQTPADKLVIAAQEHYSSPSVPLEEKDKPHG